MSNSLNTKLLDNETFIRISSIFIIFIYSIFLYYVLQLEKNKCYCSNSWEQNYIKYFSIIVIFLNLIKIFYPVNIQFTIISGLLYIIGGIIFIIAVFKYIKYLKKINCKCSENWKRNLLNIYAQIVLITFSFSLILSIIVGIIIIKNINIKK